MRFRHKIVAMVAVQVAMIVASFVAIVHFESRTAMAGNVVNVAGKNRALAITVQAEIHRAPLHGGGGYGGVEAALAGLEGNIGFLREGGSRDGIATGPLAGRFEADRGALQAKFEEYRAMVAALARPMPPPRLRTARSQAWKRPASSSWRSPAG